jgi:hypothetical protein
VSLGTTWKSMRGRVAGWLAALSLAAVTAASAAIVELPEPEVQMDVPSWWQRVPAERGWLLATPDELLVVMVWTPQETDWQQVVGTIDRELGKVIKDLRVDTKPQAGNLNGLTAIGLSGRGKVQGTRIEWSVLLLEARRPLILLSFGERGKWRKHEQAFTGFLESIRPLERQRRR